MKRWFVRVVAGLLSAVIIIGVLAWLTLRASLPELDGEIAADGIESAVVIERDAAGIPTITASNRLDLAFATGFVHGQDRFFQMDLFRRDAAGEVAEHCAHQRQCDPGDEGHSHGRGSIRKALSAGSGK